MSSVSGNSNHGESGAISKKDSKKSSKSSSSKNKQPSRFSLRRLFYGNPLLAQPFLQSPLATPAQRRWRRRRRQASSQGQDKAKGQVGLEDNEAEAASLNGTNAQTFVGPNGMLVKECPLCLVRAPPEKFPALRGCHHLFCIECLQFYVKLELQEGRGNIKCPQCVEPMHPNDVEFLIKGHSDSSNLLKLYEFLMLRRLLSTDPDTRWCPGPNCTYAVIATGCASCPRIQCQRPGCGYSFCYHCKAEWHPNQTCDHARAARTSGMQLLLRASSVSFSQDSAHHSSEVKVCPRCNALIVKMDDGSCNHMTCAVCSAEFCWLCMKEISDLHYLSPSGCTFWGKKPWSRKKKLMWQLGTLVGAPVGIALLAGISIPAMIIGIPVWVGRKLHSQYSQANKHKRNLAITGGVVAATVISPVLAGLAVSIGVPILLAYVYGVVPISLCRSEGCGVSTSGSGVKIDVDEEMPYRPTVFSSQVPNPSIGDVSLGASLSMGSACHLDERLGATGLSTGSTSVGGRTFGGIGVTNELELGGECDRESASNIAIAGTSRTVSLASSAYIMGPGPSLLAYPSSGVTNVPTERLEVGADVHSNRKKLSMSTERLSNDCVSLGDDGASTRALAGSLMAYKVDTQPSANSDLGATAPSNPSGDFGDAISMRSLPASSHGVHQRSLSPVSNVSCDDNASVGDGVSRHSSRKRVFIGRQISDNVSTDNESDRVRFDVSVINYIDERPSTETKGHHASVVRVLQDHQPEQHRIIIRSEPRRVETDAVVPKRFHSDQLQTAKDNVNAGYSQPSEKK